MTGDQNERKGGEIMQQNADVQRLAKDERETAIVYNEANGFWTIYTAVRMHMNRFDKLGYECTGVDRYPDGEIAGKFYKVPRHAISFRSPEKREYTDEQRAAMAERFNNSPH